MPLPPHHTTACVIAQGCTSTAAPPEDEDARSWQQGELPGVVLNTLPVSPQGTGVPCRSPLPAFRELPSLTHLSHRLNPHKSLQYNALSSSAGFSLDLGHTLCSKPQDTPLRGCLRGPGWPHTEHPPRCQLCFLGCPCSPSLFHVPPLLPAQPRWPQEEDGSFGEAEITPWGPTEPFTVFCKRLRVVVCYLSFSTGGISLLLQTVF